MDIIYIFLEDVSSFFVHFPPVEHPFIFFPSFSQMDGPYQDIELLKARPAHMAVFMRYVFTQLLDPNPLVSLYYLLHKVQ